MKLNLPNKLTLARIAVTPLFLLALLIDFKCHYIVALLLFIAASLTDLADGKIARKRNLVTNFGKFMDPLADKMLTTAAYLVFIALGIGAGTVWVAFIVLLREFLMTSLRLNAAAQGRVIAANIWGKAKTVCQMIAIIYSIFVQILFADFGLDSGSVFGIILSSFSSTVLWLSAVLAVVSGVVYLIDNIDCISE